ncbi:hypothetical protein [Burkholderia cepacia]|uniref:hypothetical protein n=1 Tax=Burkholderia cepacia TaxID=292 RepID=UPI00158B73F8|nr:hypothetical protein [Burkholderia cepacia]
MKTIVFLYPSQGGNFSRRAALLCHARDRPFEQRPLSIVAGFKIETSVIPRRLAEDYTRLRQAYVKPI